MYPLAVPVVRVKGNSVSLSVEYDRLVPQLLGNKGFGQDYFATSHFHPV
jgi:hypothetical protein